MPNTYIDVKRGTPVNGVLASLTTALVGAENDLVFTSKLAGDYGNNIKIKYEDNGPNKPPLVTVESVDLGHGAREFTIIHQLATDGAGVITQTASTIRVNINSHIQAKNLVNVELAAANNGTGLVTAMAATSLAGGVAGTVAVGNEMYIDNTNLYICTSESGNKATQANWKKVALASL